MRLLRTLLFFAFTGSSCLAATLSQDISPSSVNVGEQVNVTFTIQNGKFKQKASTSNSIFGMFLPNPDFQLPMVEGLRNVGASSKLISVNGDTTSVITIALVPTRAGDFTIPGFDVKIEGGGALHAEPMKLHVGVSPTIAATPQQAPAVVSPNSSPNPTPIANPPFNPNGPVVMPPGGNPQPDATTSADSTDTNGATYKVPVDADGNPPKVFMIVTPKGTDGYVGETIPMKIEFFIRLDVLAPQDSLPTIEGSNFLMNSIGRPREDEVGILNSGYRRETWVTAVSAPKAGDFPLSMTRDTYWVKASANNTTDPFSGFFSMNRPNLEHQPVASNPLVFHIHELPTEGRPANFTGVIGQLKATGSAQPASVTVGEPVTLHFTVSGEGNFDYVKCPTLADNPAWKSYVPSSKIDYLDDSRTQGVKNFEQAIIPQKNGALQLPDASFSYFDPTDKKYVTIPISLPAITVTGSAAPVITPPPVEDNSVADAVAAKAADLRPNRLEFGSLYSSLVPVYRQFWFWALQGGLVVVLLIATLLLFFRTRDSSPDTRADDAQRKRVLHQEQDAMSAAVSRQDAVAFFIAARHAVQVQLGAQWHIRPESITLAEVRQRDPERAALLEPLFNQANEVIYSGGATPGLNLAEWELTVRRQLLQLQPTAV